jgi:phage terminase Nu1 subunit (DNA packaging protein)
MTKTSSKRQGATAAQLASLWSCDERTVQRMAQKGVAVKVGRGAYDLATSTKNYILHLREQAAGRGGKDAAAANIAYRDSQTRLNDQKFAKEAGELIPVEEVRSNWAGIMRTVRQFVLGLPNQIAFEVPTLTVHDRKAIVRLCRDGLEDAAMGRGFKPITDAGEEDSADEALESPR